MAYLVYVLACGSVCALLCGSVFLCVAISVYLHVDLCLCLCVACLCSSCGCVHVFVCLHGIVHVPEIDVCVRFCGKWKSGWACAFPCEHMCMLISGSSPLAFGTV